MSRTPILSILACAMLAGVALAVAGSQASFANVSASAVSTATAATINVLPPLPSRVSLWANNRTLADALDWSGSGHEAFGLIHSNAGIKMSGSNNIMRAATRYATLLNVSGSNNQFAVAPQRVGVQPLPYVVDIDAYRPGGPVQQAVGPAYFNKTAACAQSGRWRLNQRDFPLAQGVYWVPCDIEISGSNLTARATFASTGKFHVSGSRPGFTPYYRGVQFASSAIARDAVKLSGSNGELAGLVWAPDGLIEVSGSNWNFACGIVGDRIKASGSGTRIGDGTCGSAPSAPAFRSVSTPEDTALAIVLEAGDSDLDIERFDITTAPAHGALTGTAPNLVYTPAANFYGSDSLSYRVVDSFGQVASATINIIVTPVNDAPVAQGDSIALRAGESLAVRLRGTDIENDPLTFRVVELPARGSLSGTGADLVYRAHNGPAGIDRFTFVANDGQRDSLPAVVNVTITRTNAAPTITSLPVNMVSERTEYRYDVAATDPDGDALQHALTTKPSGMSIEANTGAIRWQPTAGYVQSVPTFNAQCYIVPDDFEPIDPNGTFIAPLYQRVREAIRSGGRVTADQTVAWHDANRPCLGCHVQTQAIVGLQAAKSKAEIDLVKAEYLLAELLASQRADGTIMRSNFNLPKTQTAFALWALSYVPERERTFAVRANALRYFLGVKQESAAAIWWSRDHDSGWLQVDDAMTVIVTLGAARWLDDSAGRQLSVDQQQLGTSLRAAIPKIAQGLLTSAEGPEEQNLPIAFRLSGLAEIVRHIQDETLAARARLATETLDARLRSGEISGGGFGLRRTSGQSDPLVSAWVGFALNYARPPLTDPVVRRNIEFLLRAQRTDFSWQTNTGLFTTPLATTSLVIAYLPIALEHLGSPDVSAQHLKLVRAGVGYALSADVRNRGLADVTVPLVARFYEGSPESGRLLGTAALVSLGSNSSTTASIAIETRPVADVSVVIEVAPEPTECIVSNNRTIAALVEAKATDPYGLFDTQAFLVNVDDVNEAPTLTSTPVTVLEQGKPYNYTVAATDPDVGDALRFSLLSAPNGLYIDERTGRMWHDPTKLGSSPPAGHAIVARATDLRGAFAEQRYALTVVPNRAPTIGTQPVTLATVGSNYRYDVDATDPDGDPLRYSLAQSPLTMTIDALTGVIDWVPGSAHVGSHTVRVNTRDGRTGEAVQQFTIVVGAANRPPTITSSAVTSALAGQAYSYDVNATDPDGDTLLYTMPTSPPGMTINSDTGLTAWSPTTAQVGAHDVEVRVSDGRGGNVGQSYRITVAAANQPPTITSTPSSNGKATREYRYDVVATDPDNDVLNYTLPQAPAGMTIDANGRIRFTPAAAGPYPVRVRVADAGAFVEQSWTIDALAAAAPLTASISLAPTAPQPSQPVTISVTTTGAAGPVTTTATLDGAPLALDAGGQATRTFSAPGAHTITVTVSDGYETDTETLTFSVADPNALPSVATLFTPDHESTVTAPTPVRGAVTGGPVQSWVLAVRASNAATDAPFTILAQGTTNFAERVIASFDPTLLLNGQYTIILQATDLAGRSVFDSRVVSVEGDFKVGHFSLSFEDVSIPVAGIPVRVTRTYDTRQRSESLDFGYGWSVDYQNVRVRESARLGFSWRLHEIRQGFFSNFCMYSNGDRIVTVTLPDGAVEKFRAIAHAPNGQQCQQLVPFADVTLNFEAIEGTDSTLAQNTYGNLRLVTQGGVGHLVELDNPGVPADPSAYTLTLADGTAYALDQNFGIRTVTEPSGNTLTYSAAGIVHSSGLAVTFTRDASGRITQISLPDGNALRYTYSASGDLDTFVDQAAQTARYRYTETRFPHYLTEILDPRGVRALRNEYDDGGRLVRSIDADGQVLEYTHDIVGRNERVRDRRGNTTTYVYDDRGNVLVETNHLGQTVTRTYDADDNELTRTDGNGLTTTLTYDARGNALTERNHLGETTTRTFDRKNALLTQRDGRGVLVMTNTYNDRTGALTGTVDGTGASTGFGYDSGIGSAQSGELTSMVDALGQVTTYTINGGRGWRTGETDALGQRTAYTHDSQGRVLTETRTRQVAPAGGGAPVTETLVTSYAYDAKGRLTRTTLPDGSFSTTEYNAIDKPIRQCDALNRCTVHVYDSRGNESSTTYPDGTSEAKTYDPNGNVVAQTDRGGRTTKFVFDAANRQIETILPDATPSDGDNPRTRSEYDAGGRLSASIDENGRRTAYAYDTANRQTSITDALGNITRHEYDAAGRKTATVDALNRRTTFAYDDAGRLLGTTFADGRTTRTDFDALGRKTASIDEAGRVNRYDYDALGRLTAVVLPDPATGANPPLVNGASPIGTTLTTRYAYDAQGHKITQTDALGRATSWTYDKVGRETSRTLPLGQIETFEYDLVGRRTAHVDLRNQRTTWGYDLADRPIRTTYADGRVETQAFDDVGNRVSQATPDGMWSWAFDARQRMTRETQPHNVVLDYDYDNVGNRTALRTTIGTGAAATTATTYGFDALNRMVSAAQGTGLVEYGYDAVGNRTRETQGPIVTTNVFDNRNRLTSIESRRGTELVQRYVYTLDATGKRDRIDETDGAGVAHAQAYTYDALNRLTGEARSTSGTVTASLGFAYDAVGNRVATTEAATTRTAVFDANDRMTAQGTEAYMYDAAGNQITKTDANGTMTYAYDARNRFVRATNGTTGASTEFDYDGDGNRIARRTRANATANDVATRFVVDRNMGLPEVVAETSATGTRTVEYLHTDQLVQQTHYVDNAPIASYPLRDGLGSTRSLVNPTGTVTDTLRFSAWGENLDRTGTSTIAHQFAGEMAETQLGLSYNRARFYAPGQARFTQQDALIGNGMDPMSQARFAYAHDNPVIHTDPSGYLTMTQVSTGLSGAAILAMVSRAVGPAAGILTGVRINNIVQSRAAAKSCAASFASSLRNFSSGDCPDVRMPIVFMSETKMRGIGEHVQKSQALGSPAILNRTFLLKVSNRLLATAKCARGLDIPVANSGSSCDEYPFASSYQGGFGGTVAKVPWYSNVVQGGVLSGFYSACLIPPEVFPLNEFLVVPVLSGPSGANFQCRFFGGR